MRGMMMDEWDLGLWDGLFVRLVIPALLSHYPISQKSLINPKNPSYALTISITWFFAPANEPRTRIRFWSATIFSTFKLRVVIRVPPMRPPIRWPLKTRDG